jgi:hypothetical protein
VATAAAAPPHSPSLSTADVLHGHVIKCSGELGLRLPACRVQMGSGLRDSTHFFSGFGLPRSPLGTRVPHCAVV